MPYSKHLVIQPYKHQEKAIKYAIDHHYCMLALEPGLGKTMIALTVAFMEGLRGKKTLIVCPAFLRLNWEKEIEKFSKYYHWVTVIEKKKEIAKFDFRSCIAIISYAAVGESEDLFHWADIVIADEFHALKEITSKRTLAFHKYIYEGTPSRLIMLSGTPIVNGVTEYYSPLLLMSYSLKRTNGLKVTEDFSHPEAFYRHFAHEINYTVGVKGGGSRSVTKYEGLKNKEDLKKLLKDKYIRMTADKMLDLPEILAITAVASYEDNPSLLKAFKEFNEGDKSDPTIKAKSALLKAPFTAEYAQNLNNLNQGPILIYTDHIKSCEFISEKLKCPFIRGDVPMSRRNKLVEGFQKGEMDYLVVTIGAGSEGLTLTRSTNLIFNDLGWIPERNRQVTKRIHRIGQDKKCKIHYVIGSRQDDTIIKTLTKKNKVLKEIV